MNPDLSQQPGSTGLPGRFYLSAEVGVLSPSAKQAIYYYIPYHHESVYFHIAIQGHITLKVNPRDNKTEFIKHEKGKAGTF